MATDDPHNASPSAMPEHGTDPKVLELLVCPFTKMPLIYDSVAQELISRTAGLAFPIRHGVPLMTEDAARRLTDADIAKFATRTPSNGSQN
ncbi:MAG TPA: Trm112 family protein [Hyphomicrobium sp.]|nr:Trm112 family protein [Hyphomicrobium sp.]